MNGGRVDEKHYLIPIRVIVPNRTFSTNPLVIRDKYFEKKKRFLVDFRWIYFAYFHIWISTRHRIGGKATNAPHYQNTRSHVM